MSEFTLLKEMSDDIEFREILRQTLLSMCERSSEGREDIYEMDIDELLQTCNTGSYKTFEVVEMIHEVLDNAAGWETKDVNERNRMVSAVVNYLKQHGVVENQPGTD